MASPPRLGRGKRAPDVSKEPATRGKRAEEVIGRPFGWAAGKWAGQGCPLCALALPKPAYHLKGNVVGPDKCCATYRFAA